MPRVTTTTIIDSVRFKARLGTDSAITDANILSVATEELLSTMVPVVLSVAGNYFQAIKDHTASSSISSYEIPSRSIGNKLAEVILLDNQGNEVRVPIVDYSEDAARVLQSGTYATRPVAYVRNNKLILVPAPSGYTTLRMIYYARPGDLVAVATGAATLTVVGTTTATMSQAGAAFGVTTGIPFDIVAQDSPFPFVAMEATATVTSASLTSISPALSDVSVGDYICVAGTSPIPQIPYELHPLFIDRCVSAILAALGDRSGVSLTAEKAQEKAEQTLRLISPRIDETDRKIVNQHRPGYEWNSYPRYPYTRF